MTGQGSCPKRIILESRNGQDLSQAELDHMARDMRAVLFEAEREDVDVVAVAHDALGAGSHWADALEMFLPSKEYLKDAVWGYLVARAEARMRARFQRKHEERRPRIIVVRELETGEVVSVRKLESFDGVFEDLGPAAGESRRPPEVPNADVSDS